MKNTRQRLDSGEAKRIRGGPFTRGFTVDALGGSHQGMRRSHAFDGGGAGSQQPTDLAGHAALRGFEQRLDVATHRVEVLALVDQIPVRLGDELLDARLASGQHELLELAMRGEQY